MYIDLADIVPDITGALSKFSNLFCAPKKTRTDVEPVALDMQVNISDVLKLLNAFVDGNYTFEAGPACAVGLDARDAARKVKPVRTSSRSGVGR